MNANPNRRTYNEGASCEHAINCRLQAYFTFWASMWKGLPAREQNVRHTCKHNPCQLAYAPCNAIGLKPHAQKPSECTGRFLQEGPSRTRNGQFAARYMQARMPAETVQKTQMVHTARERNNLCTNACAHLASRQSHAKVSKRARRTRIERFGRLNVANFACQQG